jgi:hypothetical protein
MLAAAIVQDVLMIAAELQAQPIPTLVLVDEFSAVTPGRVVRLFGRGGSAGLSLLLGTPSARTNGVSPMTDPWRGRQPKYEGWSFAAQTVLPEDPLPDGRPIAVRLSHLPLRSAPPQP